MHSTAHADDDDDDDLKEYDLDHYDDPPEDDEDDDDGGDEHANIFGNIKSLAYHHNNDEDPYITLKEGDARLSDDEDREDLQILPTDNLVLAASVEDEVAHLQVYVYEDDADNLYVHHDLMLPAIPLCVEWLDMPVGKPDADASSRGNFVAVGTMEPDIELWDLDTVDCMYPNAILGAGGPAGADKPSRKKKKKSKKLRDDYHVDSVLSIAANRQHRNLLASASADKTVKLWDLNTAKCAKSYSYHTDKVCSLAWHPSEATAMLSGSYDRTVVAGDMRAPESGTRRWTVDSDVETVKWDPHDNNYFYASTEAGLLYYFDARKASSLTKPAGPVWRLQAHSSSLTTFSPSPLIPGFLATGSDDKTVKLWNTASASSSANGNKTGPSLITERELDVGRVFSVDFAPDREVGYRLAVAGSKGSLRVWDTSTNKAVRAAFAGKVPRKRESGDTTAGVSEGGVALPGAPEEDVKERFVSINEGGASSESGSSDDDEDDDEDNEGSDVGMEDEDEDV